MAALSHLPSSKSALHQYSAKKFWLKTPVKTIVYIDGYNLYYRILRKSRFKWLDLFSLFHHHIPYPHKTDVVEVRFYTAKVIAEHCDDPVSAERQQRYHSALKKHISNVVIVEGFMQRREKHLRLAHPLPENLPLDQEPILQAGTSVPVYVFVEKKTDVALASDLICDGYDGRYEQAIVCTNDADLQPAIASARALFRKKKRKPGEIEQQIGVVAPVPSETDVVPGALRKVADWATTLTLKQVALAQLPVEVRPKKGETVYKPDEWYFDITIKQEIAKALSNLADAMRRRPITLPFSTVPDMIGLVLDWQLQMTLQMTQMMRDMRKDMRTIGKAISAIPELQVEYEVLKQVLAIVDINI